MNLLTSHAFLPILFAFLIFPRPSTQADQMPNIVIIIADDFGFNDAGFRDKEMSTENIDALARSGVLLNSSYMLKSCTPSRSSLLTGTYAFRMGLQDKSLSAPANNSVPLDKRFFSEDLKQNGYMTHYVGKWHLGFCRKSMTPTGRGFHTFYGMYNGEGDYYTHESKGGYDMHNDTEDQFSVDWSAKGVYSTELFTDKAVEIINNHNKSKPLFLVLAYQAVHGPLQVPDSYITKYCSNVTAGGDDRKRHCGMGAAMDEGIGKVIDALKNTKLYKNLILFITSDNGGPVSEASSNWPLRGSKITEWEGGTRVLSILHSEKYLPKAPYVWNGLIHAVDWYPTLLSAAGIKVNTSSLDGIDNWSKIAGNESSKRTEFVYNLNDRKENYSYRKGDFKLVNFSRPQPNGWFNPPAGANSSIFPEPDDTQFQLFNIKEDPSETNNLINNSNYTDLVKEIKNKIGQYQKKIVPTEEDKDKLVEPEVWETGWC